MENMVEIVENFENLTEIYLIDLSITTNNLSKNLIKYI